MDKSETGEQKLLKIIEGQGSAAAAAGGPQTAAPSAAQIAAAVKGSGIAFNPSALLNPLSGIFSGKLKLHFGLREINILLIGGFVFVLAMLTMNLLASMKSGSSKVELSEEAPTQGIASLVLSVKQLPDYLKLIQKRNIFKPYDKANDDSQKMVSLNEGKAIVTLTEGFKLVGISWLDSPETASAMIEDTKTTTTYFLRTGEDINGVTIKKIYADRVILSYQGEELSIRL